MATLDATKLLLLTNPTKLTLIITLTITDTVTVIFFTRISLTPIKRLYRINEKNFSRRRIAGFVAWQIFYPFADKKSTVHTLSLKEGCFWGIYKKNGLGLLGAYQKERNNRVACLITFGPCV